MKKEHLSYFAGSTWAVVGLFLIAKGVSFLIPASLSIYIIPAFVIGTLKAQTIFRKIAERNKNRIDQLQKECYSCIDSFATKDYIVMIAMIGLGALMRCFSVSTSIRGLILTAVGIALVQGSYFYYKK